MSKIGGATLSGMGEVLQSFEVAARIVYSGVADNAAHFTASKASCGLL